ncbi:MAG: hypothetical protein NZ651_07300, partial [Candidatus Bipolaricaulota bacterium]|nr:hypothetical protein [Candidatus Bipolaricaulota bacterium]MDW8127559.1 hypothetical protein [Candidatus Bipolaricaulota bacterium]
MTFSELVGTYLKAYKLFWLPTGLSVPEGLSPGPEEAAAELRQRGVPVEAYRLVHPNPLGFAHLYWADGTWDIHLPPFHPLAPSSKGKIVGEPPVGAWFQVLLPEGIPGEESDVLIVYASTQDRADVDPEIFSELAAHIEA